MTRAPSPESGYQVDDAASKVELDRMHAGDGGSLLEKDDGHPRAAWATIFCGWRK